MINEFNCSKKKNLTKKWIQILKIAVKRLLDFQVSRKQSILWKKPQRVCGLPVDFVGGCVYIQRSKFGAGSSKV